MVEMESSKSDKLGILPYVIGGMSFIPAIGVLFGVVAIVWGLTTRKFGGRRLAAVGAAGIGFTVVLYGALFYFGTVRRGGIYDELRARLAQGMINSLVPAIEFYKIQNGAYPESLKILQDSLPKDSFVSVVDPSVVTFGGEPRYFSYERVGQDHYYLRGLGPDGRQFTADDIVPEIPSTAGGKTGLLIEDHQRDRRPS